jgi:hypothetical protein
MTESRAVLGLLPRADSTDGVRHLIPVPPGSDGSSERPEHPVELCQGDRARATTAFRHDEAKLDAALGQFVLEPEQCVQSVAAHVFDVRQIRHDAAARVDNARLDVLAEHIRGAPVQDAVQLDPERAAAPE